ncbi:hypothetical protein [Oscillibacter sp. 1-3]|uniref:hypothetical protein n=1 Tax=Oscillibacter sp. 1-3 TaxID=1235797 RepID=UPI00033B7C84|nr:hypothetical protein [Oscillibacter sp. 1-3]EOS62881.1 hypothetical protein C816_03940 [Oscillibacter sp. 1-3]
MSVKSQENNMRRLADLLSQDIGYIWGERESGPNGAKKTFLNLGKVFLRALSKDLGLRDATVSSNPGGIAVSGDCSLIGMWKNNGIYVQLSQPCCDRERVLLYRTVRNIRDYSSGHNNFLTVKDLQTLSYSELLEKFSALRKEADVHGRHDGGRYDRAAFGRTLSGYAA